MKGLTTDVHSRASDWAQVWAWMSVTLPTFPSALGEVAFQFGPWQARGFEIDLDAQFGIVFGFGMHTVLGSVGCVQACSMASTIGVGDPDQVRR